MSAFGGKADMIQVGVRYIWREYVAVYRGVAYVGPETGGILKLIATVPVFIFLSQRFPKCRELAFAGEHRRESDRNFRCESNQAVDTPCQ